uniref:Odorant receptor n=1 Tax=Lutzomyia longipalpis TaxID=7200 RepID=A0A905HKU9_LUTLO
MLNLKRVLKMDFEKFIKLFKFCITSRTLRRIRGDPPQFYIFFILLSFAVSIFNFFVINNIAKIIQDDNVDIMKIFFTILMCLGYTQLLLKNFAVTPFHDDVEELLDWIQYRHLKIEEDDIIQKVSNEESAKALKYSLLFFKIYLALFAICAVLVPLHFALSDYLIIAIPGLDQESTRFTHKIVTVIFAIIAGYWTTSSDSGVVFIGIYVIFFMKSVNRLINIFAENPEVPKRPRFLNRIIEKHVEMIKILNIFNEIMKFISLAQLVCSTLIFLSIIFVIQIFPNNLLLYFMLSTLLSQLALLCVFGEIIRSESEQIFIKLYQTNWYDLSVKEQRVILFMMANSVRVIGLKAGGLYDIGLMSLVQIVKLSASYAAIIMTFTEK